MKKSILFFALCAIFLGTSSDITAQKFVKIDASPMDAAAFPSNWREANKLVKVVYSRPQLKGRTIDKLAPNDKVWRTGANSNSTISFSEDVVIDGKTLKKGKYAIYTVPKVESWEVIFYSKTDNWGNPEVWNESDVAVRATVVPSS